MKYTVSYIFVFLVAFVTMGCRHDPSFQYWDLSSSSPFSEYAEKYVPLSRPMRLVGAFDSSDERSDQVYTLEGGKYDGAWDNRPVIQVPAGHLLHVLETILERETHPRLMIEVYFFRVTTHFTIEIEENGQSKVVDGFQEVNVGSESRACSQRGIWFKPAPWEPEWDITKPPKVRFLPWPDDMAPMDIATYVRKYLHKEPPGISSPWF